MAREPKLTPVQVPASAPTAWTAHWNKAVGDRVVANETLVVLEGSNGSLEVPSPASGILVRIAPSSGEQTRAGQPLGMVEVAPHATRVLPTSPSPFAPALPSVPAAPQVEGATFVEPSPPPMPQGRTLSRKLAGFGTTIFTEMTQLAVAHGAINLAQGFPDFDGPEPVKRAAMAAIEAGHGQYAPMAGLPALRSALAARYQRDHGLRYDPDGEVTITSGATEALFCALQGLCDVGDEVVLFEPYYDAYRASVCMAGAVPRPVTLHTPDWRFDEGELRRAFGPRTRAIVLNTPHNPTGKVFSREELERIAQLCVAHDVVCVTDEVYEHLVYEGRHLPMATLPGMRDRTVTVSSLGKTYSLTGWKVGWACAPPWLTAALRTAHQFVTFAVATPLQHGAVEALSLGDAFLAQLHSDYSARRTLLADGLRQMGLGVRMPQGSYFLCADIRPLGHFDDVQFCKALIEKAAVAALPPSGFYERSNEGKTYVRFAFCKKESTLREAVGRLARFTG